MWSSDRLGPPALLAVGIVLLILSGIHPADRTTWLLEVFPIFLAVPVLIVTYRGFPLTPLLYGLIFIHAVILMVGGHYTYAKVPLGFWIEQGLNLSRNPYDRVGHFAQGFVPALIAREILLRRTALRQGGMLAFIVLCICLAVSACYELIEWWSALAMGQATDAFLGTQGDPWDTQWDMFSALIGAVSALVLLNGVHDRQLRRSGALG